MQVHRLSQMCITLVLIPSLLDGCGTRLECCRIRVTTGTCSKLKAHPSYSHDLYFTCDFRDTWSNNAIYAHGSLGLQPDKLDGRFLA